MSLPYAKPSWVDGSYDTATACSLPVFASPIPATTKEYVLTQDFIQYRNSFAALAQGTAHPDYPTFFLVSEGERRDQTGGVVRWSRTYAAVPDSYDEFETYAYNYIGLQGLEGTIALPGRGRLPLKVQSRVHHDFFLCQAGQTYVSPDKIPFIAAQAYRWWLPGNFYSDAELLAGDPPALVATIPARTASDFPLVGDPGYTLFMANAAKYGWASGVVSYLWTISAVGATATVAFDYTVVNPGQLVAEDSNLVRWQGNIWVRTTRYVLAK